MGEGLNVARDGRKRGERRKMTVSLLHLAWFDELWPFLPLLGLTMLPALAVERAASQRRATGGRDTAVVPPSAVLNLAHFSYLSLLPDQVLLDLFFVSSLCVCFVGIFIWVFFVLFDFCVYG